MSEKKTGNNKTHTTGRLTQVEKMHPFKTFLFFAMVGSTLIFLSLVFLYAISVSSSGVSQHFQLPRTFTLSTIILLFSSFALSSCLRAFKNDELRDLQISMLSTFILAIAFCITQFIGWKMLADAGYLVISNPGVTFLFIISGFHMLHIVAGLGAFGYLNFQIFHATGNIAKALLFLSDNSNRTKLQLFTIYWHFVDFVWLCVFVMFLFTL